MLIDVHAHLGRVGPNCASSLGPAELLLKMDEWGIAKACVLPLHDCAEGWYLRSTTEEILAACLQNPARLIPFCLIDPRFGDNSPQTDFSDLLAEYKERGCKGLGEFIPNVYFDDPRALNLYAQAGRAKLPVLFDMMHKIGGTYGVVDEYGLPRLERALQLCLETVFIGHGPTFWAEISAEVPEQERGGYPKGPVRKPGAVPRLMTQYANLWADLSAGSGYNAISRDPAFGLEFLDRFQDKLMFGTDVVARDDTPKQVRILGYFKRLGDDGKLPPVAWRKIASENAVRLLDL